MARLPVYLRALTTLTEQGPRPAPPMIWPPPPASTRPSCARTSPTWAPTAPAASATTSSTCATSRPRDRPDPGLGRRHRRRRQPRPGARHYRFSTRGIRIAALLDSDPDRHAVVGGLDVAPFADLAVVRRARRRDRRHCDPGPAAQDVADPLVAAGVTSILNFAPALVIGARRRHRPQGRPVDRAADPRLPRAAQGEHGRRWQARPSGRVAG